MKCIKILLAALLLLIPFAAFTQSVLVNDSFSSIGKWEIASGAWNTGLGGLIQKDTEAKFARINRPAQQSGVVQYEFTISYNAGGFESADSLKKGYYHGGFGIHIGVDQADLKGAWGNGKSYLLWVNLDTRPDTRAKYPEHYGLRAQVYQSRSNSDMTLLEGYNISVPLSLLKQEYLSVNIPVKIVVDTRTGLVKVYDPTDPTYVYKFSLPGNLGGSFVSLRTNSLSARFSNFKVTKL